VPERYLPVVAAYPVVTVVLGALLLREETLSLRVLAGALLILIAIAFLVSGT
jgi:drug/metabolite transporter (DMT)-like permease